METNGNKIVNSFMNIIRSNVVYMKKEGNKKENPL